MLYPSMMSSQSGVALFARAWIEMLEGLIFHRIFTVALFARAWIEIDVLDDNGECCESPSLRGRGLKWWTDSHDLAPR